MNKIVTSEQVESLIQNQLAVWELARNNYDALKQVKTKTVSFGSFAIKVQFNPARIVSSAAKVDAKSIQERKCFLCAQNLPPFQEGIPFGKEYRILVNPFPIFPKHLTIPTNDHVDQRIFGRMDAMLDLAYNLDEYIVFYNGPKCGASAPDHAHFQAGNKGFLPIEKDWRGLAGKAKIVDKAASLYILNEYLRGTYVIESASKEDAVTLFEQIYNQLEIKEGESEPMLNVLAWYEFGKWIISIFPRSQHRPSCYEAQGDANILISPASVDMGGVFIIPQEKDFEKISANDIRQILQEVCYNESQLSEITK